MIKYIHLRPNSWGTLKKKKKTALKMTPVAIYRHRHFPLVVPGRGEHSSGPRASMAAVQHQQPRQQIPRTDLALCSEALKERVWLGCISCKYLWFSTFGVKASLLEKPGRNSHFSWWIAVHTLHKPIKANTTPDNSTPMKSCTLMYFSCPISSITHI